MTACRHSVLGSISLLFGSFHLSLMVLVHYRSLKNIQAQMVVHLCSDQISRVLSYLNQIINFFIQGFYLFQQDVPISSNKIYYFIAYFHIRSPLLIESRLISFPLVTQMFQFTKFNTLIYVFINVYYLCSGFSHRILMDHF